MNCFTKEEFDRVRAQSCRIVPFAADVLLDTETPMSVFMKLCPEGRGYLLESVEGGEQVARYSFIGCDPFLTVESQDGLTRITDERGDETVSKDNPLTILKQLLKTYQLPELPSFPRFYGGLVGHMSYDLVRFMERLPDAPPRDIEVPDLALMACRTIVVFDHVTRCARIILNVPVREESPVCYASLSQEIETIVKTLQGPLPVFPDPGIASNSSEDLTPRYNVSPAAFKQAVATAKHHIRAGDIFQVVLSQRADFPLTSHPLSVYRVLRTVNPSPYMFYINSGDFQLAGASPEMLVRLEAGVVDTKPIAGTRRRGADENADRVLEAELLSDEKERAEHVMLVDLSRNDLGRVSRYGSVSVPTFMEVERFSHVMHIVSEVRGQVGDGLDAVDVLQAAFPAGTLSGAPKVRAMEIIDDLETTRRGPYGGAVGYFGFSGNMDTCITIRTALIHQGRVYVQAGAGIVYDSDPDREYEECLEKSRALFAALKQMGAMAI